MARLVCFLLILLTVVCSAEVSAQQKKIKVHRLTIVQRDSSRIKGILYDLNEQGMVLIKAKYLRDERFELVASRIEGGEMETIYVPYSSTETVFVRRKGAVGRWFGIGAASAFGITGLITLGNTFFGKGCGCAGPPAVLVLPPAAAVLGGVAGVIVGLVPKKTIKLDSGRLHESAESRLRKYSLARQIIPAS